MPIVIPGDSLFAGRTERARPHHGKIAWQSVNAYVQKAPDHEACQECEDRLHLYRGLTVLAAKHIIIYFKSSFDHLLFTEMLTDAAVASLSQQRP